MKNKKQILQARVDRWFVNKVLEIPEGRLNLAKGVMSLRSEWKGTNCEALFTLFSKKVTLGMIEYSGKNSWG